MPRFRPLLLAIATVLSAATGAAVAADAPASAAAALYDALSNSDEARDRALAALMKAPGNDDDRAIQQSNLTFAAAANKTDAMLVWLAANAVSGCPRTAQAQSSVQAGRSGHVQVESGNGGADPAQANATLNMFRTLEPRNGAGDLLQLNRAAACGDSAAVTLALGRMGQAKQFDTHYGDAVQAWLAILAREPSAQALLKANANSGPLKIASTFATAAAEPSFAALVDACTKQPDATRATACGQAGRVLAYSSKTALDRSIGFALMQGANAMTASDNAAMRELHWLMTPPASPSVRATMGRAIAAGWRQEDDELMILRGAFAAAGQPLNPPPNWVDPALAGAHK